MANFSQIFEKILWRLELFDKVQGPLRTFLNRLRSGANFFGEFVAALRLLADRASFRMICIFSQNPENMRYIGKHCVFLFNACMVPKTVSQVGERERKLSKMNNSASCRHFFESPNTFETFRKLSGRSRNFSKSSGSCLQSSEPFPDSAELFLQCLPVPADSASSCRFCIFLPFCSFSALFRCFCQFLQVLHLSATLLFFRRKRPPPAPHQGGFPDAETSAGRMPQRTPAAPRCAGASAEPLRHWSASGPNGIRKPLRQAGCDCRSSRLVAGDAAMGNGAATNGQRSTS